MDLLRLEQQRQALEQNLHKLRASLKYWQTFEAEYEGFKEEIQSSTDSLDFAGISKSYQGELVNEKEIRELAGLDSASPRSAVQVLGVVSRRQEYVQKNIETVQRQFWDAEAKLEELDFLAVTAAGREREEGGLPLTEIHEELDEEGNVISSRLERPEESTASLIDSLRKAGVVAKDLEEGGDGADEDDQAATNGSHNVLPPALVNKRADEGKKSGASDSPSRPPARKKSVSFTADTKPSPEPARAESEEGKKSVSFNDKIAVMPAAPPPDNRSVSFSPTVEEIPAEPPVQAKPVTQENAVKPDDEMQKHLRGMFKPGEKVHELNDDEEFVGSHIVIPEDESEEDAATRREMLNYHLNEVGHIVAEMNLEEGAGDGYDDEDESATSDLASSQYQDEDTPYTSGLSDSENESEDEWGRTKRRVISDDYHRQMKDLEQRLIGNIGPSPSEDAVADIDPNFDPADVRKLVIRGNRGSQSSATSDNDKAEKKAAGKKRVSFAEALDVADEPAPPPKAAKHEEGENAAPIAETVSERSTSTATSSAPPSAPTPSKPSQFKQARFAAPAAEESTAMDIDTDRPTGPAGKIISDTLLERTTPRQNAAPPSDEDPILQRRELAAEYYRRRNEMIRQQGGFKAAAEEDEDLGELMEETSDGKLKKVSRFRAARIRGAE